MNQSQALAYLRRLRPELVPVAAPRQGICCMTCRSGVGSGYERCGPCNRHDVPRVLPISISVHGRGLHRRLRNYKDATAKAGRSECSLDLAVLLYLFLERHSDCLGGMPDIVVTAPSADRDALRAVINRLPSLRDRRLRVLRAVGSKTERSYEVDEGASQRVAGQRVLLLDDTLTSGRSITAAYGALADAGAKIVGPLVIGRHFYPEYHTSVDLWDCLRKHTWSLTRCGICGPVECPTGSAPSAPTLGR